MTDDLAERRSRRESSTDAELALIRAAFQQQGQLLASMLHCINRIETALAVVQRQVAQLLPAEPPPL